MWKQFDVCIFLQLFCCSTVLKNHKICCAINSQTPAIVAMDVRSTVTSSASAFPRSTSVTCFHFIVWYFGNIAQCPWSRSSSRSSLAGLLLRRGPIITHGCLVATECDISMLSLKRLFPACSQCQLPLSSIPPAVHWFRPSVPPPSSLAADCTEPHIFRQIDYFMSFFCSLEHSVLVLSSPPSPHTLLSLYYTSHLVAL